MTFKDYSWLHLSRYLLFQLNKFDAKHMLFINGHKLGKNSEKKSTQHILSKKRIVTRNLPIQFWAEVRPFVG